MQNETTTETDIRTVLANRLAKPIKTPSDVKEVQRMIGLVLVNNGSDIVKLGVDVASLTKTVRGENAHDGLVGELHLVIERVEMISKEVEQNKIAKEEKKQKSKVGVWFYDKVAPNIISALTIWAFSVIAVLLVIVFSPTIQAMAKHAAGIP